MRARREGWERVARVNLNKLKGAARRRFGPWLASRRPVRVDPPLETWALSVGSDGQLTLRGRALNDLVAAYGSPLHVVDGDALAHNVDEALGPFRAGRGADVFYSYKTNPIPGVLAELHRRGVGAEVISPYELWLAFELGVPSDRIIYNGPAKSPASLRQAIEAEVALINANSVAEVQMIARLASECEKRVNLGIRVALPGMWAGQFGIASDSGHVEEAVRIATESDDVNLCGLHFHRGGSIRGETAYANHVTAALSYCEQLRDRTGWHAEILDLGGGLACPTVATFPQREFRYNRALATDLLPPDPGRCITIGRASELAFEMTQRHCEQHGLPMPSLVLEPGRSLTGNTQMLLTSVVDVKEDGWHAVLDAGINIAEPVTSEYHHLVNVTSPLRPATRSYRLAGPICTPADVLYNNWRLPPLEVGHVLAIMDTGAYCVPFSTSFSFPRPAIVMSAGDTVTELRAAETFADLVAMDRVPDSLPHR